MNIFENPFYVLGASTRDNRHRISELAEEKSFLSEPNIIEDARNALIIPQKRLETELRWFPKADNAKIEAILNFLHILQKGDSLNNKIDFSDLSPLALLNISVYTFGLRKFRNNDELLNAISTIDEQFNNVSADILYNDINEDRKNASFSVAEKTDVENAFQIYRSDVAKVINEKLAKLSQDDYVILAEHIAENYDGEKVISGDIIDDYNLRMASSLEKEKQSILDQVTEITKHLNLVSINELENLFSNIKKYGNMLSPSLSVAMKLGRKQISFFNDNNEILYKVRKMALELHNNCKRSEDALNTILALKTNLARFSSEFPKVLDEDIKILEKIVSDKKQREKIINEGLEKAQKYRPKLGLISLALIVLFIIWGIINYDKSSINSKSYVRNRSSQSSSTSNRNYTLEVNYNSKNYNSSSNNRPTGSNTNSYYKDETSDALLKYLEELELKRREEQVKILTQTESQEFPKPAIITGNKVNVRNNSNTSSRVLKQLNVGHPVSVSKKVSQLDGDWYYIYTASGTKGWVREDYVNFVDANLSHQELENRKKSLPTTGIVNTERLNVRNIPALNSSQIVAKLNEDEFISIYEIFATEERDWYYIKRYNVEGWVSGKYINLGYSSNSIKNEQRIYDVFELARTGTVAQMRAAVRHGANFNVKRDSNYNDRYSTHSYGETPLHRAAQYNRNPESIKFLIEQGIDVNAFAADGGSSGSGGTPLSDAIGTKNISAIRELLRAGADPNANLISSGLLEHLSYRARLDKAFAQNVLNMLIKKGINLNAHQKTPPSDVRFPYEEKTMSMVEIRDLAASRTSLISAVIDDNPNFVDILLDAGVRVDLRDMFNKTAIDYAYELPTNSKIKKSHVYSRLISIKPRH